MSPRLAYRAEQLCQTAQFVHCSEDPSYCCLDKSDCRFTSSRYSLGEGMPSGCEFSLSTGTTSTGRGDNITITAPFAAILAIAVIVGVVCWWRSRRRRQQTATTETVSDQGSKRWSFFGRRPQAAQQQATAPASTVPEVQELATGTRPFQEADGSAVYELEGSQSR